ncbi:tetratricopeptide repeat protein [Haliangium sp.]|uniref:tetratricopeptide repeat protein n=1 Tax=Haliangium sp. TaxID=2663208 RepID=UPI003D14295A
MRSSLQRQGRAALVALMISVVTLPAVLLPASPAQAQDENGDKAKAREFHRKGRMAYDVGNFDEAIEYFKKAYELAPHEAYLYNIAQIYRQNGDCRNALFFYKRYVAVGGEEADNYELAQKRIRELSEDCQAAEDPDPGAPLPTTDDGTGDGSADNPMPEPDGPAGDADDGGDTGPDAAPAKPPILAGTLELGPSLLELGDLNVSGIYFSLGLGVGYPIHLGKASLSLGAMVTYTPVPWDNPDQNASGTSALTSVLGNVGLRYRVLDRLDLRAEAGAGVMVLTGLQSGNVFVAPGNMASGAIGVFNVRAALGAEYALTDNLLLSVSPVIYSYSPTVDGLRAEINSFVRFELLAGLGFRL